MTQWEYRIVEDSDAAYSQIAEMLNDLGSQEKTWKTQGVLLQETALIPH
jgi:hypothetical protein